MSSNKFAKANSGEIFGLAYFAKIKFYFQKLVLAKINSSRNKVYLHRRACHFCAAVTWMRVSTQPELSLQYFCLSEGRWILEWRSEPDQILTPQEHASKHVWLSLRLIIWCRQKYGPSSKAKKKRSQNYSRTKLTHKKQHKCRTDNKYWLTLRVVCQRTNHKYHRWTD